MRKRSAHELEEEEEEEEQLSGAGNPVGVSPGPELYRPRPLQFSSVRYIGSGLFQSSPD